MEGIQPQTRLEVTDSEILILAAGQDAHPATLNVPAHTKLEVWVNGERAAGRYSVYDGDKITAKLYDEPAIRTARVEVTPDGLQATLHVEYAVGVKRRLSYVPPSEAVTVEIEEVPLDPAPFELAEIQKILQENKITYQVEYAAIADVIRRKEGGECVCSVGIPPVEAVPERYEMVVEESNDVTLIGIMPVHPVVSVLEGTVVAQYQPSAEGTPGVSVRSEPIPPQPLKSKLPNLGKGVERLEDGQVVARRSGRVVVSPKILDVAETLVFERDLQARDGYVMFDGDVVVRGDVAEGTEIMSGGTVFVSGAVSQSTISADEGIVVNGGVFASTLRAGLRVSALSSLSDLFTQLLEEMGALMKAIEQVQTMLVTRGAELPAGKIAAKLMEDRFASFREWPNRIEDWLRKDGKTTGSAWSAFAESLKGELLYARLTSVRDVSSWKMLLQQLSSKVDALTTNVHEEADIEVGNAQNSSIHATGSITCTHQGYYQCHLSAGNSVRTTGNPGAILACTVLAGNVYAREIGSHAETHTTIQLLNTDGSVNATTVHPGTMLSVGGWRHKVPKEMKSVKWP